MENKSNIYDAKQLALDIQDTNQPNPVRLTEEELIDLWVIALS